MANVVRFAHEGYAVVEINKISAPDTNRVFAQLPLSTDATTGFTKEDPCENGMWLVYDQAAGVARKPKTTAEPVALMYLNEKAYEYPTYGKLSDWALVPDSYCPRVYFNAVGDTYTTNCFCYDDSLSQFSSTTNFEATMAAIGTTPVYVIPSTSGVPQLVMSIPTTNAPQVVGQVVKYYTLPDGQKAIKIAYIKAC